MVCTSESLGGVRITVGVVFDAGAGGFSSPDSPCCLPVRSSTSRRTVTGRPASAVIRTFTRTGTILRSNANGPTGERRHPHLHPHGDNFALERDRVDLQVFDRRVERRLRKAGAAKAGRV